MYFLSILIPAYNVEDYIIECLNSIFNQKSKIDFELIIVNDGSSDNTDNLIKSFINSSTLKNITYISQDNKGASSARNTALSNAKGKYLWFIDADDKIEYNAFSIIEEAIEKYKGKTIIFNYNRITIDGKILKNNVPLGENKEKFFLGEDFINDKFPSYLWLVLYKKDIITKNNVKFLENTKNLEDFHFNMQYFLSTPNVEIVFINKYIYNYNYNRLSTSRNTSRINLIKLADDSYTIHSDLLKKYFDLKKVNEIEKAQGLYRQIQFSILGFFFSLLKFYDFELTQTYYNKYKRDSLIPIKYNFKNKKLDLFKILINSKSLFLFFKKII